MIENDSANKHKNPSKRQKVAKTTQKKPQKSLNIKIFI